VAISFSTLENNENILEVQIKDDDTNRYLYAKIQKKDAKQIISFLQNHFNL
jgi:hypothetical protein